MEIIVNRQAGHGAGPRKVKGFNRLISRRGLDCTLLETRYSGHATLLARRLAQRNRLRIGVMGGDGTISEVINGLSGSNVELAIIPIGTGNDVARSLGLPIDNPSVLLEIALEGVSKEVDVAEAGGRSFISVLGAGFPVEVAAEANRIKRLRGSPVFLLAMCKALTKMRVQKARLELDDRILELEFTSLLVQNTPSTGGGLLVAPNAALDDGLLDIVVVDTISKAKLMLNLPRLYQGTHLDHPNFTLYRSKAVKIYSSNSVSLMVDGDPCGRLPVCIKTRHKALKVVVGD
jgi:diacylglycerol kinase (ATP)